MERGTIVRWFTQAKKSPSGKYGFGFIHPDSGGPDVFVHRSDLSSMPMDEGQYVGSRVEYFLARTDRGFAAKRVTLAANVDATPKLERIAREVLGLKDFKSNFDGMNPPHISRGGSLLAVLRTPDGEQLARWEEFFNKPEVSYQVLPCTIAKPWGKVGDPQNCAVVLWSHRGRNEYQIYYVSVDQQILSFSDLPEKLGTSYVPRT